MSNKIKITMILTEKELDDFLLLLEGCYTFDFEGEDGIAQERVLDKVYNILETIKGK